MREAHLARLISAHKSLFSSELSEGPHAHKEWLKLMGTESCCCQCRAPLCEEAAGRTPQLEHVALQQVSHSHVFYWAHVCDAASLLVFSSTDAVGPAGYTLRQVCAPAREPVWASVGQ